MKSSFRFILSLVILVCCMVFFHHGSHAVVKQSGNVLAKVVDDNFGESTYFRSTLIQNTASDQVFLAKENEEASSDWDHELILLLSTAFCIFNYHFYPAMQDVHGDASFLQAKAIGTGTPKYILFHRLQIPFLNA